MMEAGEKENGEYCSDQDIRIYHANCAGFLSAGNMGSFIKRKLEPSWKCYIFNKAFASCMTSMEMLYFLQGL